MLGMNIISSKSTFQGPGLKIKGHCGYFKKNWIYVYSPFVIALAPAFIDGFLLLLHTNVGFDNILSKFDSQGPGHKVKDTVAILRKTLSSL